ncbi:UDP-N-acetylmuramate:L-alanyl-gamma-D-glutamyl-meso-diaminopimelate ligase [Lysobacter sp. GX 14042]|nr:UDP-N-acetylmuramate:L-alanyl-gamma-D-glutamyl-meso-diaminopimelate ligase [Lysobacter sp. GX 14042]
MGGVAALARELGHRVEGSDQAVYPPMSTQLEKLGIWLSRGYDPAHISADCDQVVVGNALSRGNPAVEQVLDDGRRYTSGAQWLAENVLPGRDTLAVAGTHGKTTTSTILAFLLEAAGRAPGFLIGGVPDDFGVSARIGGGAEFVVEADEYDTAFFDKRSKFVHYRPRVAVLNNLEFDHADIFDDLDAIKRQFHHFVRTVPRRGRLVVNGGDANLAAVLAMGCWTPVETFGIEGATAVAMPGRERDAGFDWTARLLEGDGSAFQVLRAGQPAGEVHWPLLGRHNVMNALAAIASAAAVGVDPAVVLPSLSGFAGVKRRMELLGSHAGITVYDDFAHHPTAIATTLEGLRARVGGARIVVAMEPRSNSMRLGAHADALGPSLALADLVVFLHRPELAWDAGRVVAALRGEGVTTADADGLIAALDARTRAGDHVVFMSNGGFDGAPRRFLEALRAR